MRTYYFLLLVPVLEQIYAVHELFGGGGVGVGMKHGCFYRDLFCQMIHVYHLLDFEGFFFELQSFLLTFVQILTT